MTGRAVPLAGISEGVLGGRLQARHCGSAQACSGINIHNDHGPTTPAGTTLPSSPSYVVAMTRPLSSHEQELLRRLEDVECGRHKPLKSCIGPRLYTTSLRLHQPRLNPSTWTGWSDNFEIASAGTQYR